jgi:hypothetical protein
LHDEITALGVFEVMLEAAYYITVVWSTAIQEAWHVLAHGRQYDSTFSNPTAEPIIHKVSKSLVFELQNM